MCGCPVYCEARRMSLSSLCAFDRFRWASLLSSKESHFGPNTFNNMRVRWRAGCIEWIIIYCINNRSDSLQFARTIHRLSLISSHCLDCNCRAKHLHWHLSIELMWPMPTTIDSTNLDTCKPYFKNFSLNSESQFVFSQNDAAKPLLHFHLQYNRVDEQHLLGTCSIPLANDVHTLQKSVQM